MAAILLSSGETVSSQMKVDLSAINRFEEAVFENFVDLVFNFLLSVKKADTLVARLTELSADTDLSVAVWKSAVRSLLSFLRDAGKRGMTANILRADLTELGIQLQKAATIARRWELNYVTICRSVVSQTFMINQLVDMEWKFGVTAASSEMQRVGNSFLQLKLVVSKDNESTEDIFMELSLPQFYSFLHEMERVKTNLDLLL